MLVRLHLPWLWLGLPSFLALCHAPSLVVKLPKHVVRCTALTCPGVSVDFTSRCHFPFLLCNWLCTYLTSEPGAIRLCGQTICSFSWPHHPPEHQHHSAHTSARPIPPNTHLPWCSSLLGNFLSCKTQTKLLRVTTSRKRIVSWPSQQPRDSHMKRCGKWDKAGSFWRLPLWQEQ